MVAWAPRIEFQLSVALWIGDFRGDASVLFGLISVATDGIVYTTYGFLAFH